MARRALLLGAGALLLGLPACGFRPVYGRRGVAASVADQLNRTEIAPLADRTGQILRNELIDRFYLAGRPADPAYRLDLSLFAVERELGIQEDDVATRVQLALTAQYRLSDRATGEVLFSGESSTLVFYNILDAQFATLVAEEDAFERGLTTLADDITTRISLYFTRV